MSDTHDRVESLFAAALARTDSADRAAYLDQVCADDPALRAHLEALLRAAKRPGDLHNELVAAGPDLTDSGEALCETGPYPTSTEQPGTNPRCSE
ncbi:MAG: hypothetical protein ACLQIB_30830 [Isosphaeraceae bacterium]